MKLLKKSHCLSCLGIAAALTVTPVFALAQTTVYAPATSRTTTTVTSGTPVNPNSPVQFPPANVGMAPDSLEGKVKAAYVDQGSVVKVVEKAGKCQIWRVEPRLEPAWRRVPEDDAMDG